MTDARSGVERSARARPQGSIEHDIPGDYQLRAMLAGWPLQRAWHRARLDLVARVLPPAAAGDGLLLDAACGAGIVAWRFRPPGLVNVDMRPSACEAVRAHVTGARAIAADLDALPFRTGAFSQTYLLETIEHLAPADGIRALAELRRVTRAGGRCLVTTPNYGWTWPLIERAVDASGLTPPLRGAQHVTRYDRRSLLVALRHSGWRPLRLGTFNLAAPLFGVASRTLGARMVGIEADWLRFGGPLLFAVCERSG